jgi:hypothetical protein
MSNNLQHLVLETTTPIHMGLFFSIIEASKEKTFNDEGEFSLRVLISKIIVLVFPILALIAFIDFTLSALLSPFTILANLLAPSDKDANLPVSEPAYYLTFSLIQALRAPITDPKSLEFDCFSLAAKVFFVSIPIIALIELSLQITLLPFNLLNKCFNNENLTLE